MTHKIKFGIISYSIGMLLLASWGIVSLNYNLNDTTNKKSEFITAFYTNKPNLITFFSYIFFTFSSFLFLKEKKKIYVFTCITSFLLLLFLLYKLIK
jgi:uncharacterized protein (DUF486 family)